MSIFFELRYPTKWYTKLGLAVLALIFFVVLATIATAGFILYRIVKPQRSSTEISMASFPGKPDPVTFTVPGLGERDGWFFPGLRNAPTILLLHGYESSRGELLTLESALQDHEYNVFIFDFAAHGTNGGVTTFGYRESDEVRAAIDAIASRNDVDPSRFGIWGYNLGAYAGLREAEVDKRIRAMILDSVYDKPEQMVKVGVERNGLGGFPLMIRSAEESFLWLNRQYRQAPPLSRNIKSITGVPTLYIQAVDDPELASLTRDLFLKAPEPREQAVIPHGNFTTMDDDDKRAYENRIVSFFLLHLPPTGPGH